MSRITQKNIDSAIACLNESLNLPDKVGTYDYSHNEIGYRLDKIVNKDGGVCTVFDFWFKTSEFYYIILAFRAGKESK
jgi:hypothetical protein